MNPRQTETQEVLDLLHGPDSIWSHHEVKGFISQILHDRTHFVFVAAGLKMLIELLQWESLFPPAQHFSCIAEQKQGSDVQSSVLFSLYQVKTLPKKTITRLKICTIMWQCDFEIHSSDCRTPFFPPQSLSSYILKHLVLQEGGLNKPWRGFSNTVKTQLWFLFVFWTCPRVLFWEVIWFCIWLSTKKYLHLLFYIIGCLLRVRCVCTDSWRWLEL